jgi:HK97 family phage major capsid protein
VRDKMGDDLKSEAAFYERTWEKWFRSRKEASFWHLADAAEQKAMQENTDVEGGFFVPEDFRTITLHDPGVPGSVHRPYCSVLTTSLKDGYFPTFGSVTWAAIAEEAAYGDNTHTVGQVPFSVNKSGGTVKVSAELLEDMAANLPALLSQVFNEALGRYEDTKIIAGSGSNEPEGLRTALGASQTFTTAAATAITAADMIAAYWLQPAQYRQGAIFSTSSSFMAQVFAIGSAAAGIHFIGGGDYGNPNVTQGFSERLFGKPVVTFDGTGWDDAAAIAATEVFGVWGDFKNYYLIDRIGMSLRRDDSIYVANDQVGFFARKRFDGRVGVLNAFRLWKQHA